MVQVLKDDVKNKIHDAAVAEFKEKGFLNASMRSIAKRSGMTVGNLYRYYKNKENLFSSVVNHAYSEVVELTTSHGHPREDDDIEEFIIFMADSTLKIFLDHRDELLILIDGSEGTKYENVKSHIIDMIKNHKKEFIDSMFLSNLYGIPDKPETTDFMIYLISYSFIDGLIKILKTFTEKDDLRHMIIALIKFCFSNLEDRLK